MIALLVVFLIIILLTAMSREYFASGPINKKKNTKMNILSTYLHKLLSKRDFAVADKKEDFVDTRKFNIFNPHMRHEYENLMDSYGDNLFSDNLSNENVLNASSDSEYLKNFHMNILNKNIELQKYIDDNSVRMNQLLDNKMNDIDLLKLAKDSKKYYTFLN